jgi:multidrug transporter EmrE-like cation transporter
MGLAKRAAIGFLSFLLFLSLSAFGLGFTANRTVLNPDFVISQLDRLDVPSLAEGMLIERIPEEMGFMAEYLDDVVADLGPWIRDQASIAVYAGYDYLLGKSESLSLVIDMEPMKESLRDSAWQAFLESPPPELSGIPSAEVERYFNEFYREFSEQIPPTIEINESMISPEIMARLEQARRYIGYLQLAYRISIGAMIAIIVGLVFLHRRVKGATRSIGIPCLTCGISIYVSTVVIKYLAGMQMIQIGLPAQLQAWLPQFLNDSLAPMQMFGIGLMVAGTALLVVSVVYKRHQPSVG